ncbi:hypothetical protein D3C80_521130 [compost metagenome]
MGAGGHDIIRLQHFDHLGAVDAQDRGETGEGEHDRRQDNMLQRGPEGREIAVNQAVDQKQAGDEFRWAGDERQAPRDGQPFQIDRK